MLVIFWRTQLLWTGKPKCRNAPFFGVLSQQHSLRRCSTMVFGTISILRDRTQAEERLLKQRHKPDKPNVNNMASKKVRRRRLRDMDESSTGRLLTQRCCQVMTKRVGFAMASEMLERWRFPEGPLGLNDLGWGPSCKAVIKMIIERRSPTMRHVSRTPQSCA